MDAKTKMRLLKERMAGQRKQAKMISDQVDAQGYVGGEGYLLRETDANAITRGDFYREPNFGGDAFAALGIGDYGTPDGRSISINDLTPEERAKVNYMATGVRALPRMAGEDTSAIQAEINRIFANSRAAQDPTGGAANIRERLLRILQPR